MLNEIIFLIVGIFLLYAGGEALVKGSSALALRAGMSSLAVGLTVVAFGTSAPEVEVSVGSALQGKSDISIGNVVGSNICNIGFILAATALICPLTVQTKIVRIDFPILLLASLFAFYCLIDGLIQPQEGMILIAGLMLFCAITIKLSKKEIVATQEPPVVDNFSILKSGCMIVFGLLFLVAGGHVFVEGAVGVARLFSLSEAIIGLTVVAVGTSLPELATSLIAAIKGETDIAVGNVIGSCIFNILGVLGFSAMTTTLPIGAITWFDLNVMLLFSFVALPLCISGWRLSRLEGALLILCYVSYVAWRYASV
jgi:cation:H+ antiporter